MDYPKRILTFADGYSVKTELNGTTYFLIDAEVPDSEISDSNLVTVTDKYTNDLGVDVTETKTNQRAQLLSWPNIPGDSNSGKKYLVFMDIPADELKYREIRSKIDYLAIMTDNDISE